MNPEWASTRWDRGHPYALRTWLRGRIPWFLIRMGVADKGRDCEAARGWHRWYNHDDVSSACYHCRVVREGRLWEDGPAADPWPRVPSYNGPHADPD